MGCYCLRVIFPGIHFLFSFWLLCSLDLALNGIQTKLIASHMPISPTRTMEHQGVKLDRLTEPNESAGLDNDYSNGLHPELDHEDGTINQIVYPSLITRIIIVLSLMLATFLVP